MRGFILSSPSMQGRMPSGVEVEKLRGKKFGSMIDAIMMLDDAVIDVGASNVEDFMKMMQQYDGSHEEIDIFVVPTVKEKKVQADTVNTVSASGVEYSGKENTHRL